jgi:DnaJ-class molecular chaperone
MKDLYKILDVPESADAATIKKAYRKLAKEFHPDVTGGDKKKTERFKEINEAYDVLGSKDKRAEYNRLRSAPVRPDGMPEGFDAEAFARTFGGGGGGGAGGVRGGFGGGNVDIGDIFGTLFGDAAPRSGGASWGRGARQRVSRGNDIVGTVELPFEEAALGTRRTVRTGEGSTVEVGIPAGVETGARLRVAGKGAPAPSRGGTAGDLYLEIQVLPHPHFQRDGLDVEVAVPITITEAALGAKVQVPTVDGPVTVSVPPGTSSGAKLRLRARGIKSSNDGTRGDQFCRIEIVVPKGAPDKPELRRLFEELARLAPGEAVRDF